MDRCTFPLLMDSKEKPRKSLVYQAKLETCREVCLLALYDQLLSVYSSTDQLISDLLKICNILFNIVIIMHEICCDREDKKDFCNYLWSIIKKG